MLWEGRLKSATKTHEELFLCVRHKNYEVHSPGIVLCPRTCVESDGVYIFLSLGIRSLPETVGGG